MCTCECGGPEKITTHFMTWKTSGNSQRLLEKSQTGLHMWENATPPPFGPFVYPTLVGFTLCKILLCPIISLEGSMVGILSPPPFPTRFSWWGEGLPGCLK